MLGEVGTQHMVSPVLQTKPNKEEAFTKPLFPDRGNWNVETVFR